MDARGRALRSGGYEIANIYAIVKPERFTGPSPDLKALQQMAGKTTIGAGGAHVVAPVGARPWDDRAGWRGRRTSRTSSRSMIPQCTS